MYKKGFKKLLTYLIMYLYLLESLYTKNKFLPICYGFSMGKPIDKL